MEDGRVEKDVNPVRDPRTLAGHSKIFSNLSPQYPIDPEPTCHTWSIESDKMMMDGVAFCKAPADGGWQWAASDVRSSEVKPLDQGFVA